MTIVLRNEETREKIKRMKAVDSDHQPITVWVEGERCGEGIGEKEEEGDRGRKKEIRGIF